MLLSIHNLLFLLLESFDFFLVEIELDDRNSETVLIKAHLGQICKHYASLHLLDCLAFKALESFISFFDIVEEANIVRVMLNRLDKVNFCLLDFA